MRNFKDFTKHDSRTYAIGILTVALVLVCVFAGFSYDFGIAYAVSPDGYNDFVVKEVHDWYMGENYLNLAKLKESVSGWFSSSQYDFSNVKPVVVAVVDSGINYGHELFTGKYDENGVAVDVDGIGEYDVLYRDSDGNLIGKNTVLASDKNYASTNFSVADDAPDKHGTHVAGIIATFIHELNLEKYVKIMPVKSAYPTPTSSTFSSTAFRDGVQFALENGADVVNMSLAAKSTDFRISAAQVSSAVFVAAAGNGEKSWGITKGVSSEVTPYYPGASDGVVGVMNYTKNASGEKVMSSTSNYGLKYDVCAPGSDYYSADGATSEGYKKLSGTSMASPVVSFGAALAILQDRARSAVSTESLLTPAQIAKKVKNSIGSEVKKDNVTYSAFDLCTLVNDGVSIKIRCDGDNLSQNLSDLNDVTLSCIVYPFRLSELGKVEWFEIDDDGNETRIATGFQIDYTPDSKVYTTRLYAKWTYESETEVYREQSEPIAISVNYLEYAPEQISKLKISAVDDEGREVSRIVCQAGKTYSFTINDFKSEFVSPTADVQWYVNGVLRGRGFNFEFKPESMGNYTVIAKINGHYTSGVQLDVALISEETADVLKIFTIVASVAILAAFAATMLVVVHRKRKS